MSETSQNNLSEQIYHHGKPFLSGGLAGMTATVVVQPIDMLKVQIQLSAQRPWFVMRDVVRREGFFGLYRGLSAGLLRQATYTTARLGFFNVMMEKAEETGHATMMDRAFAGLAAGAIGALIGTPADLALVRMQTDSLRPESLRRNYRHVGHVLSDIVKNEGIPKLWTGALPTMSRAMALNFGMLSTYSEAKMLLEENFGHQPSTPYVASAIAGFFASFCSLPFDFVKTRMQNRPGAYSSVLSCITQVAQQEGLFTFYKGFGTYYFRAAPHAMITLLIADYLHDHLPQHLPHHLP